MDRPENNVGRLGLLIARYRPRLLSYVRHFVDDPKDAEDIVQDSFFRYWSHYSDVPVESFPPIMFKIVRNVCLNWLRSHKTVEQLFDRSVTPEDGEALYGMDFLSNFADSDFICIELEKEIKSVLESLSPKCREAFVLSRIDNLSNKEVAKKMGISVSTVEKHIIKVLKTFRAYMKEREKTNQLEGMLDLFLLLLYV